MNRPGGATAAPSPTRTAGKVDPVRVCGFVTIHALALLAPWTFTWPGFAVACVLVMFTGHLGIGLGYHRLLAHRSFTVVPVVRYLFALLGVLALQGGPLSWCAVHRRHHRHSDQEIDPQQSSYGFLRAHFLWALSPFPTGKHGYCNAVRDLNQEAILRYLERFALPSNLLLAVSLLGAGWGFGGRDLGLSLLTWGMGVRAVYFWHVTLLVNSVCHRWGYRNYATPDESHNSWWVALLAFGEGWHNNHHAFPRRACLGHRWFEFDPAFFLIRALQVFGVASRIVDPARAPSNLDRRSTR